MANSMPNNGYNNNTDQQSKNNTNNDKIPTKPNFELDNS